MRNKILTIFSAALLLASCINPFNKTVKGNGQSTTQERSVSETSKIKTSGSFDIHIIEGNSFSVKVQADENLMPYIITENKDGFLNIHAKEGYNLSSHDKMLVTVTTSRLEELALAGSGNATGEGRFTGGDHLKVSIAGSGDIKLDVNTPQIESHIAGTGNISLSGETRKSKIEIAGNGDYKAGDLKSEDVEIHIAGSGNAGVFADHNLDIHIAGSGDVIYKGDPSITQEIAGNGKIHKE